MLPDADRFLTKGEIDPNITDSRTKAGATILPEVIFSEWQNASNSIRDANSCHIHYYFRLSIFSKGQQHSPEETQVP